MTVMCKGNYAAYVRINMPFYDFFYPDNILDGFMINDGTTTFFKKILDKISGVWHNWYYNMSNDTKTQILKEQGGLNPKPEAVKDELFQKNDFFDSRDLVQTKYEMVRRVEKDDWTITQASKTFGFSRPCFYDTKNALKKKGFPGLIPAQRGPKRRHKLSDDVMIFVEDAMSKDETLRAAGIVPLIEKRFGFKIHSRSIERALVMRKNIKKNTKKGHAK